MLLIEFKKQLCELNSASLKLHLEETNNLWNHGQVFLRFETFYQTSILWDVQKVGIKELKKDFKVIFVVAFHYRKVNKLIKKIYTNG